MPQAPVITTAAARSQGSPGRNASNTAVATVATPIKAAAIREGCNVMCRIGVDFTDRLDA